MDNFVTETDLNLLQNDKYTFFVLGRILHGNCNFVASNHKTFIICHSCEPFPLWIWTSDDISQSEKEEIYKILDENSFLNGKYTFNLKYEFAEFLINRAKTENKTLSIHKNMYAPIEFPSMYGYFAHIYAISSVVNIPAGKSNLFNLGIASRMSVLLSSSLIK